MRSKALAAAGDGSAFSSCRSSRSMDPASGGGKPPTGGCSSLDSERGTPYPPTVSTCAACGHDNVPEARLCSGCGRELTETLSTSRPASSKPREPTRFSWVRRRGDSSATGSGSSGSSPSRSRARLPHYRPGEWSSCCRTPCVHAFDRRSFHRARAGARSHARRIRADRTRAELHRRNRDRAPPESASRDSRESSSKHSVVRGVTPRRSSYLSRRKRRARPRTSASSRYGA
jgi:hypothetical protein